PFFPAVAARTCQAFAWHGFDFPDGTRVMFDLYGTNRDRRHWRAPETFDPTRFDAGADMVFGLVPQGGGLHAEGHRCPGEWIALALDAAGGAEAHRAPICGGGRARDRFRPSACAA